MIKISTNDNRICNRDQIIIDIISSIQKNIKVELDTMTEGPCAKSLGLYDLLDNICNVFSYPKSEIVVITGNLLESHPEYTIIKKPTTSYLDKTKQFKVNSEKQFDDQFKHFGNFIGHGNLYRLQLAAYMYANHQSITLQTYHCDVTDSYHRSHIGLEDLLFENGIDAFSNTVDLLSVAPLTLDLIDSYPILMPETLNITKAYPNFFVEIANITYFSGATFYVDEKIWRPILMKTPFMVQGSQNFILNLHRLGFKTFSNWWDEGYNQDPVNCQVPGIIDNVKQLSTLTVDQLKDMYAEMLPTLEHNYNRFMTLTKNDFIQAFTS